MATTFEKVKKMHGALDVGKKDENVTNMNERTRKAP